MKRTIRKPGFWVALILGSFIINIIVAWITVHQHFPAARDISFFGPPQQKSSTNTNGLDPIPESVVWHRMLQERADDTTISSPSSSLCNRTIFQGNDTIPYHHLRGGGGRRENDKSNRTFLVPGGFRTDVGRFVREKTTRSSSSSEETCFLPPSSSCQVSKYSVVVYSEGNNWRQLFLNLLSFMAYPSVSDITLILPFDIHAASTTTTTKVTSSSSSKLSAAASKDQSYADRIIEWGKRRTIRLLYPRGTDNGETESSSSLWSAMQQTNTFPGSESILWINGDVRKDWSGSRLKRTLQAWKGNPRLLFASRRVVESSSSSSSPLSSSRCPFPDLHQLMMHRNFLCYLGHPVMDVIRQHATSAVVRSSSLSLSSLSSWNITQTAVTMIWNHVANGHVIVPFIDDGSGGDGNQTTIEKNVGIAKETITKGDDTTNLILEYLECDCVWASTMQLSSLKNGTCYQ